MCLRVRPKSSPVSAVKRGTILDSVYGIGTLTAQRSLAIKSGIMTTIRKIYVNEGDIVTKGQHLIDLDTFSFTAPFAGIVIASALKEGETVFANSIVMTLADTSDTYLVVSLEQQGALKVKPGMVVKVSFDGMRDQPFDGKVDSIYSNNVDFLARISVKNLPKTILPGMTADVAIILRKKDDVLLVPISAIEGTEALIRRGGSEMRVPIEVGLNDGAYAEVFKGDLREGDEAVVMKKVLQ